MKHLAEILLLPFIVVPWLAGIALASIKTGSAIAVCLAVVFPPYAWYQVVFHFVERYLA